MLLPETWQAMARGKEHRGAFLTHEVKWKGQSLDLLKGKVVRLEFQLHDADLYTFRAAGAD